MAEVATKLHQADLAPVSRSRSSRELTPFHERIFAEATTLRSADSTERIASALSDAKVDLNPHQIEAAAFALESLPRGGCLLADEVGLGKTIEASMVLAQLVAEGKERVLILCPATLRAQWQSELREKFDLDAAVVDGRSVRKWGNPFEQPVPVIASIPFAAGRAELLAQISWDVVVIDEAHRLRNCHRVGHKTGKALRSALRDCPKILLTATPLQNELSELFGLLLLLDEQILGPEHAFKARFGLDPDTGELAGTAQAELKERLSAVVHRTLRRQVREYVRFTHRRSVVEDFAPSSEEQELYEAVSEYLRRSEAAAIEPGKKTLLTLVYRKLLASSTYAIAPTLRKLADSLEKRLEAVHRGAELDAGLYEPDEAIQYSEEAEAWADEPARKITVAALESELAELRHYADMAERIRVNAKGEALKRALDRIFTLAKAHQWPEKAVIFTESRRTQDYLFTLLSDHGYRGNISKLSGDASTPEEKRELVEEFRDRTQILLSTEAGAEGLNLQFCNLVVNYDLPWNPQRIEQRIGRCHRYGQARDVLVLNFLNRQNAADARLFELLEKKLTLFDGVFGASDEILGALESGVDFERRVLEIYQACRTPEEIDRAFFELRSDLERRIDQRMTAARSMLLEHFDSEVRRRMKLAGDVAKDAILRRRREASLLTDTRGMSRRARLAALARTAGEIRQRPREAISYLTLDASGLPPRLARYAGRSGWWFVYRFELGGLRPEERLVHLVLLREKEGFIPLPITDGELFLSLRAAEQPDSRPDGISVSDVVDRSLADIRDELVRSIERRHELEIDRLRERAARFAEDCLLEKRESADEARAAWERVRRELLTLEDATERTKARALADRREREYRKKLAALRAEEDARFAQKDRAMAALAQRAQVSVNRTLIASAYFSLR